ncbi:MAG: division/cell wall cluster transcriptional repressor MraZ [Desulfobulbaceae bacterium]|nr:division/cell wall cluster transcriptional repressor MraZ [Desulfobulbaceae bacterium]MCK5322674.1 division/cell wall cluster transcriptional repressor MraZ [Desulfobulbaceae bacterium]
MGDVVVGGRVNHFRSHSDHSLDGKGRLNVPTRFRDVLRRHFDDVLMVVPWEDCLRAYPQPVWEKIEVTLLDRIKEKPEQKRMMEHVIRVVTPCPLDKQGRILLSPKLRDLIGIEKDVVLSGVLKYFEIWDKGTWEEKQKPTTDEFESFDRAIIEWGL